jgi:pyrimidine-nucleoside phosphorylase
LGLLASSIGAGRSKVEDKIAFNAGIQLLAKKGERVEKGQPLCLLWVDNDALLSLSLEQVANLVSIQEEPVAPVKSLILHEVMGA